MMQMTNVRTNQAGDERGATGVWRLWFKNLEGLQNVETFTTDGFEARKITLARPDGQAIRRMV